MTISCAVTVIPRPHVHLVRAVLQVRVAERVGLYPFQVEKLRYALVIGTQ